jgi:putative transposase
MIDHTQGGLSIVEQCKILGVNRSTWYYRGKDERGENVRLMDMIDEVHLAHPTWGSRTIRDHFRNNGIMVNRKRIQRLMGILHLTVIYPKKHLSRRAGQCDH